MNKITQENSFLFNQNFKNETPKEIIEFLLDTCKRPIITTSFGGYSEVLLHAVYSVNNTIPVVWIDTGLNTVATYKHAAYLTHKYKLNLKVLSPKYTNAYLDFTYGAPSLNNPNHEQLAAILKTDPLNLAFKKLQPDLWFTNIRQSQTAFRANLDILSFSPQGILKASPFYYKTSQDLHKYVAKNKLKTEFNYNDPVKANQNRECGIHFTN